MLYTFVFYIVFVYVTILVRHLSAFKKDGHYFNVIYNVESEGKFTRHITFSRSETECTFQCSQHTNCCNAAYTRQTEECHLHISDVCTFRQKDGKGATILLTEMRCELPLVVPDAEFSVDKVVSSGEVGIRYVCTPGTFLLTGDLKRRCIQGSEWNGKAPVCKKCPTNWHIHHGTSCYRIIISPPKNWKAAFDGCRRIGSKLVEIETKEEGDFIRQEAMKTNEDYLWIGGEIRETGYWHWATSGYRFTYTDWGYNRPDKKEPDRVVVDLMRDLNYHWNNAQTFPELPYICEIRPLGDLKMTNNAVKRFESLHSLVFI